MHTRHFCAILVTLGLTAAHGAREAEWQAFFVAAGADGRAARKAIDHIAANWRDGYTAMILDLARLLPSSRGDPAGEERIDLDEPGTVRYPLAAGGRPRPQGANARRRLIALLEKQTRQRFGDDLRAWRRWIWSRPEDPHPDYARFKGELYAQIDPEFRAFFPPGVRHDIRLDEIDWGGVTVNGIPPLREPRTIPAAAATWLRDNHVVFGVYAGGEARAYPKRILAWHELATDRLGGVDLTIVYCTLCGTVVPYESAVGDRRFTFGTSGLLYRSNKLMFDEETRSLWSSLEGRPVVGPLAVSGLQLRFHSAVTTTWGDWKRDHPATTVLSLETGFDRDYSEGAAYRDYFATDRPMFEVPATDSRLRNKAEVLVLRPEVIGSSRPVAISVDLLRRRPLYTVDAGGRRLTVVSSRDGANRVYESGEVEFVRREPDGTLRDRSGRLWTVTPEALAGEGGARLPRVAAHRAFWFGWYAQHPNTVLHK
jgi:hypothetical protein